MVHRLQIMPDSRYLVRWTFNAAASPITLLTLSKKHRGKLAKFWCRPYILTVGAKRPQFHMRFFFLCLVHTSTLRLQWYTVVPAGLVQQVRPHMLHCNCSTVHTHTSWDCSFMYYAYSLLVRSSVLGHETVIVFW
jgi:hypothetical protein